jgi:hypothetical protein
VSFLYPTELLVPENFHGPPQVSIIVCSIIHSSKNLAVYDNVTWMRRSYPFAFELSGNQ